MKPTSKLPNSEHPLWKEKYGSVFEMLLACLDSTKDMRLRDGIDIAISMCMDRFNAERTKYDSANSKD